MSYFLGYWIYPFTLQHWRFYLLQSPSAGGTWPSVPLCSKSHIPSLYQIFSERDPSLSLQVLSLLLYLSTVCGRRGKRKNWQWFYYISYVLTFIFLRFFVLFVCFSMTAYMAGDWYREISSEMLQITLCSSLRSQNLHLCWWVTHGRARLWVCYKLCVWGNTFSVFPQCGNHASERNDLLSTSPLASVVAVVWFLSIPLLSPLLTSALWEL